MTIFANCVALAIYTPYPMNDSDKVNAVLVCKLTSLYSVIESFFFLSKVKHVTATADSFLLLAVMNECDA